LSREGRRQGGKGEPKNLSQGQKKSVKDEKSRQTRERTQKRRIVSDDEETNDPEKTSGL